ncbi:hypothetical protein MTO96_022111 [Rhipicephalus appendiculatus]
MRLGIVDGATTTLRSLRHPNESLSAAVSSLVTSRCGAHTRSECRGKRKDTGENVAAHKGLVAVAQPLAHLTRVSVAACSLDPEAEEGNREVSTTLGLSARSCALSPVDLETRAAPLGARAPTERRCEGAARIRHRRAEEEEREESPVRPRDARQRAHGCRRSGQPATLRWWLVAVQ